MKRKPGRAKKRRNAVQVWTHTQARNLVPYLKSVMASVREHKLAEQQHRLAAQRLAERPKRPDREALITLEETRRSAEQAADAFDASLEELQALDIYCLDPIAGQALVPTVHEDQLAWFVYDHFDNEPLRFWRYHTDPLEMRRPMTELKRAATKPTWTA
jgi:Uncharacterized conserved protein (DUF2203)